MKVGSLVVIKPYKHLVNLGLHRQLGHTIKWMPNDDEETIYTIREMSDSNSVLLEEGIIGYRNSDQMEIGMDERYLREIQPPMEGVAEIVEEAQLEMV